VDTVHECDRQTDRITITNTVQRIASHGNNILYNCYSSCGQLTRTSQQDANWQRQQILINGAQNTAARPTIAGPGRQLPLLNRILRLPIITTVGLLRLSQHVVNTKPALLIRFCCGGWLKQAGNSRGWSFLSANLWHHRNASIYRLTTPRRPQ